MTTIINGSNPAITFPDGTTQTSAGLPSTGGNITGNLNVSGNLGVGTTSPATKLDVNGSLNLASSGNLTWGGAYGAGIPTIAVPAAGSLGFYPNGSTSGEKMRITSAGDVGIGTTSPGRKLTVQGIIGAFHSANDSQLLIYNNGTDSIINSSYQTTGAYTPLAFYTSGSERARITTSGTYCFNTVNDYGSGSFSSNVNGINLKSNGTIYISQNNAGSIFSRSTTGTCIAWAYQNTLVGSVQIGTSSTTYATTSDYRLKENVKPIIGALEKVAQLNPVTYNWKVDGSDGQGFIAHELGEVCPDAVVGKKDEIDEEGNPVYQGIDPSKLVATLAKAIQELKAELDATKAEVEVLKDK